MVFQKHVILGYFKLGSWVDKQMRDMIRGNIYWYKIAEYVDGSKVKENQK